MRSNQLAETEGFEPSVRLYTVRRFSKPVPSATRPRLRIGRGPLVLALGAQVNAGSAASTNTGPTLRNSSNFVGLQRQVPVRVGQNIGDCSLCMGNPVRAIHGLQEKAVKV